MLPAGIAVPKQRHWMIGYAALSWTCDVTQCLLESRPLERWPEYRKYKRPIPKYRD